MKTILALTLLLSSSGTCWNDSKCEGEPIPVVGTPADYHTKAGEHPELTLHAPVRCGDQQFYIDGYFIALEGKGIARWDFRNDLDGGAPHKAVAKDAFRAEVGLALKQKGIDAPGGGFGTACGAKVPACAYVYFGIRDWKLADAAVQVVMDKMTQWQLGECVGVMVSGQAVLCPQ